MKVEQRELVLVPFPFSDFSGRKVRPVLVLSKDKFNEFSEDVVVCGVTSNIRQEYSVEIKERDLEEGYIFEPCCVKAENILKINKKLLIKKIGKLKKETFSEVLKKLTDIFS